MTALTRLVLRHRLLVALVWLVVAVAGVLTVGATTASMTNNAAMPGTAYQVDSRIVATYGNGGGPPPLIPVVTAPAGTRVGAGVAAATAHRALAAAASAVPGSRLVDLRATGDPAFVTADSRTTFGLLYTRPQTTFGGPDPGPALGRALAASLPPGWSSGVTGSALLASGAPSSGKGTGVLVEALVGSVGALVVLALLFGSFLAVLPLLVGAVSVLAAFLAVGGLEQVVEVSQIVEFVIALIGLGIAIDYSLLVVTRWREERAAGADRTEAVVRAMEHAGRAVVLSGLTVAIGLLSLVVLPVPFLRSVGYGGVLVPLASVAAAVTLLPVVLATVGPALDRPRRRRARGSGTGSRFWTAWGRLAYRRRWLAAGVGVLTLAALALPALDLTLGEPGSAAQAASGPAHDTLARLVDGGVPAGVLTPIEVLTSDAPARVAQQLRRVDGVFAAVLPAGASSGAGAVVVSVLPRVESTSPAGQDTVRAVRDAVGGDPDVVGVGGTGASTLDFVEAVYGQFPLMLTLIAIATFLLLARAFRSVLLAAKAVVFNLVSLAAAYGILTWVWQQGHGSQAVFGVPATGAITMWVPLTVFAFLFGLSMDYEVFILSRIREEYDRTGSAEHAVAAGLGHTGRLVTGAAAILLLTFVSMATGPTTDLKILATGLGAGIVVDAVVVRCLLVPALVALFGRANWWMPARLARVLRIRPAATEPPAAIHEPAAALTR